jgi:hypothetical protein
MDDKRKNEIGNILFKKVLLEEFSLKDIRSTKRKLGNLSKECHIPLKELLIYTEVTLKEIFEREINNNLNKETKVGSEES